MRVSLNSLKVILPSWGCPEPQNNSLRHQSWYVYCWDVSRILRRWLRLYDKRQLEGQHRKRMAIAPVLGCAAASLRQRPIHAFPLCVDFTSWPPMCEAFIFSVSAEFSRETSFFFFFPSPPSLFVSSGTIRGSPGLFEWNPSRPQTLPSSQQTAPVFQRVHPTVSVAFKIS